MLEKIIENAKNEIKEKYLLISEKDKKDMASIFYDRNYISNNEVLSLDEFIEVITKSKINHILNKKYLKEEFYLLEYTIYRISIIFKKNKKSEYEIINLAYLNLFKVRASNFVDNFVPNDKIVSTLDPVKSNDVFIWSDQLYIASEFSNEVIEFGSKIRVKFKYGFENEPAYIIGRLSC